MGSRDPFTGCLLTGVPRSHLDGQVSTGRLLAPPAVAASYTGIFAETLIDIAAADRSAVAITAAMPGGTGVDKFGKRFPKRTFDVGPPWRSVAWATPRASRPLRACSPLSRIRKSARWPPSRWA